MNVKQRIFQSHFIVKIGFKIYVEGKNNMSGILPFYDYNYNYYNYFYYKFMIKFLNILPTQETIINKKYCNL